MLTVAVGGLIINVISALVLHRSSQSARLSKTLVSGSGFPVVISQGLGRQ